MTKNPYSIGIDLGGTKIEVLLLDDRERILYRQRIATPRESRNTYEVILSSVCALVRHSLERVPAETSVTVGIGIPGIIYPETGLVQNANTTCLTDRPFKADIEAGLGLEIAMENDANCFTLAECAGGAGVDYPMVFGIIMGTGCGGGLCIDGRIQQGRHHIGGEWGHFSIDPQGAECYCGNRGCIETKISGSGVENVFSHTYGQQLAMKAIVAGYRRGEPRCVQTFERFLDDFGRSLGGLISILDPDAVVLGGGLSNIDELYTLGVKKVGQYAFHRNLSTPILKNSLGDSAGVFGAARIGKAIL